jgi:hypothetical protein
MKGSPKGMGEKGWLPEAIQMGRCKYYWLLLSVFVLPFREGKLCFYGVFRFMAHLSLKKTGDKKP